MKNFNIFWVPLKNPIFRGGGCLQKTNIEGGDYLKRWGAWTVCRFKGERGLARKKRVINKCND